MDAVDRKLLAKTEKGLPLTPKPFHDVAAQLGITSDEVLTRLQRLKEEGVIRRFGASIRPNSVGFSANAMVAWKVPAERIQEVGAFFSGYTDVSHCYERQIVVDRWEYNLYTVMHAPDRTTLEALVKRLSEASGLGDFTILYSTRNLKTSKEEKSRC
ncbi:MAG: AsnC family transcriptional regulator [Candidatus Bathyarchaeota archaeon]|nr:AsnC family transcriptional regulator [Candidatus Bathyarchaeota archaeon]